MIPAPHHVTHGTTSDTMSKRFDRCSAWKPDSDGPTYNLGRGRIEVDDDVAAVQVTTAKASRADLPDDIEGYTVLCSHDGDVVYEGTVTATGRVVTYRGQREELRCQPAELED